MTRDQQHPDGAALQAWLEEDLSVQAMAELADHLGGCGRCRNEVRSFEMLFSGLESVERSVTPEPGPQFARRVMADILHQEAAVRVRRNSVMVPAAAAAFFAMVLALWLLPSHDLPSATDSAGGLALPVVLGALLKIVHSGALMISEGIDLAFRLARTAAVLLATLPLSVWATCLTLFCAVHGALFLCLQQYARRDSRGPGSIHR